MKEEKYIERETNKSNWKYIYIYIRTILKHNMATLTNHENIQNNINQEAPTTTTPEVNKADTCNTVKTKVGKSTAEYEVSFDDVCLKNYWWIKENDITRDCCNEKT